MISAIRILNLQKDCPNDRVLGSFSRLKSQSTARDAERQQLYAWRLPGPSFPPPFCISKIRVLNFDHMCLCFGVVFKFEIQKRSFTIITHANATFERGFSLSTLGAFQVRMEKPKKALMELESGFEKKKKMKNKAWDCRHRLFFFPFPILFSFPTCFEKI